MDISKSIQESFELYRRNFGTILLATLISSVGCVISVGILAGPLVGGMLMLCLKLMRGEAAGVGEIFSYFNKFVPTFIIVMALWLTMLIAAGLGKIPVIGYFIHLVIGPAAGIIFVLAVGLVVERNVEPIEALKQAVDSFMTNPLMIWFYSFIISFLSSCGAFLFLIPVILTMPLGTTGMAIAYQKLNNRDIILLDKMGEPK